MQPHHFLYRQHSLEKTSYTKELKIQTFRMRIPSNIGLFVEIRDNLDLHE